MTRFVLGRLLAAVGTLVIVSMLIFAATEILPGDPATAALGRDATPQRVERLREQLHLDRPVVERYGDWAWGLLHGDLGRSAVNGAGVADQVGDRLRNSALLLLVTLAALVPLSLLLGVVAALREGSRLDTVTQVVTVTGMAVPEFVVGAGLIVLFGIVWPILPAVSITVSATTLVLPAVALVFLSVAYTARMVRAGVIEVLHSEHVAMARLKGLSERKVIRRHVLPNALGPATHALALTIAYLAGGVVIIEYLFGYPGIGGALVDAVSSRDAPTIEALTLIIAAVYIVGNLLADVTTILLTPRLRTQFA
jgi:peptide/nickel transport system permease protein